MIKMILKILSKQVLMQTFKSFLLSVEICNGCQINFMSAVTHFFLCNGKNHTVTPEIYKTLT